MSPTLSIIIPTYNRTRMLERAIDSALAAAYEGDIEVVVVPNGPHRGWVAVQASYQQDARVRWFPIERAHACAARNHGLKSASGEYVRFLDDDDYLLPQAAEQLAQLRLKGADIAVAPLAVADAAGQLQRIQELPVTRDFAEAALLSIAISNMTAGCIFRRASLAGLQWREDMVLYDDYLWIIGVAQCREVRWHRGEQPVAAYVEHAGPRLSRVVRSSASSRSLLAGILDMREQLRSERRITSGRDRAVASALLTHAHSAFPASPFQLGAVIRMALAIDPKARPLQPLFAKHPWLATQLIAVEWGMLLPRYLTRGCRRISWFGGALLGRSISWLSARNGTSER